MNVHLFKDKVFNNMYLKKCTEHFTKINTLQSKQILIKVQPKKMLNSRKVSNNRMHY